MVGDFGQSMLMTLMGLREYVSCPMVYTQHSNKEKYAVDVPKVRASSGVQGRSPRLTIEVVGLAFPER